MALGPVGALEGGGCGNELGGSWSKFHGNIPNKQVTADEVPLGAIRSDHSFIGKTEAGGHRM